MLYIISASERASMLMEKLACVAGVTRVTAQCLTAIVRKWGYGLGPTKVGILTAIIEMSVMRGYEAIEISLDTLVNGVKEITDGPFQGLGMSIRSARTHVDELCSSDFINVFHVLSSGKQKEGSAKIIEINFKKVLNLPDTPVKNESNVGKICLRRSWYIHRYCVPHDINNGLDKSNLLSPGSTPSIQAGNSNKEGRTMLPTPKRMKSRTVRSDSIAVVMATTNRESTARRISRAAAAVDGSLNTVNLQALLDTAMKSYNPTLPRLIVTTKAFSVFKKRVVAANITNLRGFIDFAIRDWSQMASQNRAALLKNPSRAGSGPISPAPTFDVLAYRLPYFIAAYSNSLVQGVKKVEKSAEQKIIAEQAAKIARLESDKAFLVRRTRSTPPPQTVAHMVDDDRLLSDDWTPPKWEERTPALRRAGRGK